MGLNSQDRRSGADRLGARWQWRLTLAALAFFLALSYAARLVPMLFGLAVVFGMLTPVSIGLLSCDLPSLGFARTKLARALPWGVAAGAATSLIGLITVGGWNPPVDLPRQLMVGVPLWLLIISPFQEFFFRGLLQPVLGRLFGDGAGLLLANVAFTVWHYLSPLVDMPTFPLKSVAGLLATFLAGLIYGFAFLRSRSILAPWLGHAISGIVFIAAGAMDFGMFVS